MVYRVTYAIDYMDPNPTIETFETESEAVDWLHDEVQRRVDHIVQHSQYYISESERESIVEGEYCLACIDRVA